MSKNNNSPERLIGSREMKHRLGGVSDMSIWRWEHDESLCFPKPIRINRRKYWNAAEIDQWISDRNPTVKGA